jgi:hypothetical protein
MTHRARASHVGSCLSIGDILAVLCGAVLQVDSVWPGRRDRDRLIVSKGHAAAMVYAALEERNRTCANTRNVLGLAIQRKGRNFCMGHALPAAGTVGDVIHAGR